MIEINKLNKVFNPGKQNSFHGLKDIDLTIQKNELVILKGVSGSGKSTLLSIIASFMKPSDGYVKIDGESIIQLSDIHLSNFRKENIGFIFQTYNLFEYLTVEQNIIAGAIAGEELVENIQQRVDEVLEIANISHKKNQTVSNLSGGEKQRVAIARALINNPKILLCDEPTASLDKHNSLIFIEILKKLHSLGKTIIIATHDVIFDDLDIKHRIINIEDGKIVN